METPREIPIRPAVRAVTALLPSLVDVLFLMPLVFLFSRLEGIPGMLEGDTGWHLRTGDWILANGRVPSVDLFSFTRPGEAWFAWEWLWDVLFSLVHTRFGMAGVILINVLLLCVLSVLLYRFTLRCCGYRLPAAAFTFLAMAGSTLHWLARPHLITLLFVVATLWVLEWKRSEERNLLWTLPLLTVVWVNLHGGFIAVLLLLGCYAAGELAAAAIEADSDRRGKLARQAVPYSVTAAACLAASLVNPYTYRLHIHMAKYLGDPESPFFKFVGEWQSISFHMHFARFIEILMVAALASCFWHVTRRRFGYVFLALGWLHLGLVSARHLPIFALVSAPFAAQAAVEIARSLQSAPVASWLRRMLATLGSVDREFSAMDRLPRLHLVSLAGFLLVAAAVTSPLATGKLRPDYPEKGYPVKALNTLPPSALAGNVFTEDEWGDYLIYRGYPTARVFVDGRFDFYGAKHTQLYLDILGGKHDWEKRLKNFGVDGVLLTTGASLASTLKESGRWIPVYDDGVAILFHTRERVARATVPTGPGPATGHGKSQQGGENHPTAQRKKRSESSKGA